MSHQQGHVQLRNAAPFGAPSPSSFKEREILSKLGRIAPRERSRSPGDDATPHEGLRTGCAGSWAAGRRPRVCASRTPKTVYCDSEARGWQDGGSQRPTL